MFSGRVLINGNYVAAVEGASFNASGERILKLIFHKDEAAKSIQANSELEVLWTGGTLEKITAPFVLTIQSVRLGTITYKHQHAGAKKSP